MQESDKTILVPITAGTDESGAAWAYSTGCGWNESLEHDLVQMLHM